MFEKLKLKLKRKAKSQWYDDVAMGKSRFILYRGVVCWGLPMFVGMTLVVPFVRGDENAYQIPSLVFGIVLWGLGGILYGWIAWSGNAKRFGMKPSEMTES